MNKKRIVGLLLAGLLFLACSKPNVMHSAINGEVKQIALWKLEYNSSVLKGIGETETSDSEDESNNNTAMESHSRDYTEKLKKELTKHGFNFSINNTFQGNIILQIQWYTPYPTETRNVSADEIREHKEKRKREGYVTDDDTIPVSDLADWILFGKKYKVYSLKIEVFDAYGQNLGEISLQEDWGGNIKPDFAAKAIAKIITEGKY